MYIARGASSKLPGYISPSDQKFSYYYPGVDPYYGEDYQILTCKVPGAYLWRPFRLSYDNNFRHKEVFVDDTKRFFIAQFHGPIDCINRKEFQKAAYCKDPILGFIEFKKNPSSYRLSTAVVFYMGKSYDMDYDTLHNIANKVSYLSVYTVSLPHHIRTISQSSYSVTKLVFLGKVKLRIPENAVCSSTSSSEGNSYATSSTENIAITFSPQTTENRYCTRKRKIIVADDPNAFELKRYIETDVLHNTSSCDSIMIWPSIEEMPDFDKNFYNPSCCHAILGGETSEEGLMVARITYPYTLQDLCRNVILASTLGIPNSIDCLPLPIGMKEYCKQLIS